MADPANVPTTGVEAVKPVVTTTTEVSAPDYESVSFIGFGGDETAVEEPSRPVNIEARTPGQSSSETAPETATLLTTTKSMSSTLPPSFETPGVAGADPLFTLAYDTERYFIKNVH